MVDDTAPTPEPRPMPPEKPWYQRKRILVPLVIGLLLLLWLVPPIVANPVPVGLDAEGQQAKSQGGWKDQAVEKNPASMLGGFVFVESAQIAKGQGTNAAVYTYSAIKLDMNLPKLIVVPILKGQIVSLAQERGLVVDPATEKKSDYDRNGASGTLYTMSGEARGSYGNIPVGVPTDVFVNIWRCSITGSWGVAVGAASTGGGAPGGPGLPLGLPGGGETMAPRQAYDEMRNQLLPNTVCLS